MTTAELMYKIEWLAQMRHEITLSPYRSAHLYAGNCQEINLDVEEIDLLMQHYAGLVADRIIQDKQTEATQNTMEVK